MKEDLILWEEFRLGIETSFKTLFIHYHAQLFNYGHKFTSDDELIEDVVQELFIKLWRNRESINNTPSVKNYLYKAFRRIIVRKLTYNSRFTSLSSDDKDLPFQIELSHDHKMISDERLQSIRRQLNKALEQMTARQREIIHLRYFEDMSYEEIAEVMDLSTKSTYKLLYRAIDSLKEYISPINLLALLIIIRSMQK